MADPEQQQQPTDSSASDERDSPAIVNSKEERELDSTAESKPAPGPPPFPEGGREAWTVAFGAWLAILVSFGFLNAFGGAFQQFYVVNQLAGTSSSAISWIGSFQTFCIYFLGTLFGALFDRWGAKPLIVIGGVGFALSCMLQSISTHYWHFLLSQGLLGGIALSCLFTPAYTAAQHWFLKRRGFALGIVTSGSSIGGVIWPILANRLILDVGFGWALRIMGFISLALCLVSAVLVKGRLPPRKGKQFFAFDLFMKPGYTIFCVGMFFVVWGLFFLIFFLPSYGALHGFDANMTFYSRLGRPDRAPIAGALIANYGFWAAQTFAGVMLLVGSILIFVARQSLSAPGKRWIV